MCRWMATVYFKFSVVAWCLALLSSGCAAAQSDLDYSFVSSLAVRQAGSSMTNCNATCSYYQRLNASCNTPHCGCTVQFLQGQGECLVCQTVSPQDAANVQVLLDAEINQCHREKIEVNFQLDLPPPAAEILQKFYDNSASLRSAQTVFLGLQIAGGQIGLVVVLLFAIFSGKALRDSTFINFCITWIFSSIVFSLLLYRGTDGNNISNSLGEVPPNKCLGQAAIIEGAQVMTACSTLAFVIQLWLGLREAISKGPTNGLRQTRWITWMLLMTPYILFLVFALTSVYLGANHIEVAGSSLNRAIPTNFYCIVAEANSYLRAVFGVTLGLLIITVIFDVLIIMILYRHWWDYRRVLTKSTIPLSIILRVMAFSMYRIVVAFAYGSVLNRPPTLGTSIDRGDLAVTFSLPIWVDMLQAALPLSGFIALGVKSELFKSCMFWRMTRSSNHSLTQPAKPVGTLNNTQDYKVDVEADAKIPDLAGSLVRTDAV